MKLASLLSMAFISLAPAQEGAAVLSCRFLCFERDASGTASLVAAAPGDQMADCPLPLSTLSKPVKLLARGGMIEFRKSAADPSPLVSAKVPAGISAAIILFVPQEAGNDLGAVVIEDSAKGFPPDGCVVLNLYQADVRFVIGEHKVLLPAGKTAALARPSRRDDFNMSGVAFQFQQGRAWRTAAETMLRFPEGQRHLLVTYLDAKTSRPRLKSFRVDP